MSGIAALLAYGKYICDSVQFDGTNDAVLRGAGLTGAVDSKTGIFSAWIRIDANTDFRVIAGETLIGGGADRTSVGWLTGPNQFIVTLQGTTGTVIAQYVTSAFTAGATWLHMLSSWDGAASAFHLYMNDVSDKTAITAITNNNVDYTTANYSIGGDPNGAFRANCCFADFYFAPGQFLDLSVTANRRKFISVTGKPVDLGPAGAAPTGTSPISYHHVSRRETPNNFALNRGTGGDYTVTGTLTLGSTSPSD